MITKPSDGTPARGAHGGSAIEDPPGERQGAAGTHALAPLRDPHGKPICALHRPG